MKLLKIVLSIGLFVFVSCNDSKKETAKTSEETKAIKSSAGQSIILSIDGKTRAISANERVKDTINFNEHPVKTLFRKKHTVKDNNKFEINLNFYEKDILDKIPITYTLPQDNAGGIIKIDLNFFDSGRKVEKSMNKRLIFEEGTITIHELNRDKIRFDFEGEVHELMSKENTSSVSGSVDVKYFNK